MAFAVAAELDQLLLSFPITSTQMEDSVLKLLLEQISATAVVFMDDVQYPSPQKLSDLCVLDFLNGTMAAARRNVAETYPSNTPTPSWTLS